MTKTYDPETLAALRASIEKWEAKAKSLEEALKGSGTSDCALCQLFHSDCRDNPQNRTQGLDENDCQGCPVAEHTGKLVCRNTPYRDWAASRIAIATEEEKAQAPAFAQAEADFLRSLLPAEPPVDTSNVATQDSKLHSARPLADALLFAMSLREASFQHEEGTYAASVDDALQAAIQEHHLDPDLGFALKMLLQKNSWDELSSWALAVVSL